MGKAVDQAETVLVVAGVGLATYFGYKLVKALAPLGNSVAELPDRATAAVDVAANSSLQAGWNEWKTPACDDPSDPNCIKRQPGTHEVVDEQGNHVGWRTPNG